ncbi:hypothetical protein ABT160_38140 [Streptomyces sp. NPDC001941]|uniref:hypothetical protein n=1 Tax=Streptomyces sp. NPDC001941 TaxID=3154659 RepID=UPI00331C357E
MAAETPTVTPAGSVVAGCYGGPRIAAADFFTHARSGRGLSELPSFADGDSVCCPQGTEWMRYEGRWIVPGQAPGLALGDDTVRGWWRARHQADSKFALVHRLTPDEIHLIGHGGYVSSHSVCDTVVKAPVSGRWLRQLAWHTARTRTSTLSVHVELPTGIVTLHSRGYGDVFFHPAHAFAPARTTFWPSRQTLLPTART